MATLKNLVKNNNLTQQYDDGAITAVRLVQGYNNSYALNMEHPDIGGTEGGITALSLSDSPIETLELSADDKALEYLYLSGNKSLKKIVFETALPNLTHLYLDNCALAEISIPAGCIALQQIYLQKNGLKKIVFEGDCPNLILIDCSETDIQSFDLPNGFGKLQYLFLNDNNLLATFKSDDLPLLEEFHVKNANLQRLPESIVFGKNINRLYANGNAPKNIPNVFLQGNCLEDARIWFEELRNHTPEKNKIVKLMLTGNGNAGKSSLLCALEKGHCEHDHSSTHGIQIAVVKEGTVEYNVWDFGGQEVYHGTHRLFMESRALQVIVFDPKTEELAEKGTRIKDRISNDDVLNHPIEYWYETIKNLSSDSVFLIVQNKKDVLPDEYDHVRKYAKTTQSTFLHISAKKGQEIDDLHYHLQKGAKKLPDYDMDMPSSWLKVRQFFIDNLAKEDKSQKIMLDAEFEILCQEKGVNEQTMDLLFRYLHHNGFLYYHKNLGNKIIADQRWALEAIYKPLDRKAAHYEEFKDDLTGKIRVKRLFEVFGETYTSDEKWLFLEFMKSCGLCFQLNNKPYSHERSESDVYVFPEMLPFDKPESLKADWQKAQNVVTLRYGLAWLNYSIVQSFIVALGRKTATKNIWRNGIHVSTTEGWFKVELDYTQKAIVLSIEESAMSRWLEPILEELKIEKEDRRWEIATDGQKFKPFDLNQWKNKENKQDIHARIEEQAEGKVAKPLQEAIADVKQQLDRQVVLFVAANPPETEKLGSQEKEYAQISRKTRGYLEVIDLFGASAGELNDKIIEWHPSIIHFCGHAESDGIELHDKHKREGQILTVETLSQAFESLKKDIPQIEVVFLNACYTEKSALAISKSRIYAVGTNKVIKSIHAIPFAEGFYTNYSQTKDVIKSVRHGLRHVLMEKNYSIDNDIHVFYNSNSITI